MNNDQLILLASASPRRAELLRQLGVDFIARPVDIDETPHQDESPDLYVERMAREKARAAAARGDAGLVLGSDTVVVQGEKILGKPRDKAHGLAMLAGLSNQSHRVMTAVVLVSADGREAARLSVSRVSFRALSEQELEAYWRTGEPADKAGGYGIQGYAAAFISDLEGSYSGVMGLPLFETSQLLAEFGLDITAQW